MFKSAVQYVNGMKTSDIQESQFDYAEVRFEDIAQMEDVLGENLRISGIVIDTDSAEELEVCAVKANMLGAEYVVLETWNAKDCQSLYDMLKKYTSICTTDVKILVENSYKTEGGFDYYNDFSDGWKLKELVTKLNELGKENFGICLNVGYANVLEINIKTMVKDCKEVLRLVHVNDNNGIKNQMQIPYTFTTGRGEFSTDWVHIVGALYKMEFEGWIVFDTVGTFKRTPQKLHRAVLKLLAGISKEWEDCYNIEDKLNQPEKKLILFGAGKMAQNYLEAFGDKCKPSFLVDNNKDIWGQQRFGYEVKSPQEILNIPEAERNVWICNMYYDAIGLQLDNMGIEYNCYIDHYYL